MKENENHKTSVTLTEVGQKGSSDPETSSSDKMQKLRKPLIFILMGFVFIGCMYLIFAPSSDKKSQEQTGLNEAVPQSTEAGMQADKSKAYESDLLEQKELEKKKSLDALSDYWNADTAISQTGTSSPVNQGIASSHQNEALNSYRGIQSTLGSFYDDRAESRQLQNEVKTLKAQLAQREKEPSNPVENQLALMEKSYQMAAKYFPTTGANPKTVEMGGEKTSARLHVNDSTKQPEEKRSVTALYPKGNTMVSTLYRETSDSAFIAELNQVKNRSFYTVGKNHQSSRTANSIRACIHETQIVTADQAVRLRLLEAVRLSRLNIPKGTVLTAIAKFEGSRLALFIQSVEFEGHIIPVEISAYDVDGQKGLALPFSPERNALTEIAANMGNTGGTSISLSSSAGQQITTDLSKSVLQGISGYFAKKVRMPKITLKAGYQVFLVAKK